MKVEGYCTLGSGYCAHKLHDLCVVTVCSHSEKTTVCEDICKSFVDECVSPDAVAESEDTVSNDEHPALCYPHLNADPHIGSTHCVTGPDLVTPIMSPVSGCTFGRTV